MSSSLALHALLLLLSAQVYGLAPPAWSVTCDGPLLDDSMEVAYPLLRSCRQAKASPAGTHDGDDDAAFATTPSSASTPSPPADPAFDPASDDDVEEDEDTPEATAMFSNRQPRQQHQQGIWKEGQFTFRKSQAPFVTMDVHTFDDPPGVVEQEVVDEIPNAKSTEEAVADKPQDAKEDEGPEERAQLERADADERVALAAADAKEEAELKAEGFRESAEIAAAQLKHADADERVALAAADAKEQAQLKAEGVRESAEFAKLAAATKAIAAMKQKMAAKKGAGGSLFKTKKD